MQDMNIICMHTNTANSVLRSLHTPVVSRWHSVTRLMLFCLSDRTVGKDKPSALWPCGLSYDDSHYNTGVGDRDSFYDCVEYTHFHRQITEWQSHSQHVFTWMSSSNHSGCFSDAVDSCAREVKHELLSSAQSDECVLWLRSINPRK